MHGLAIRRREAGKGLGRRPLSRAEERAFRAGEGYLRLDRAISKRALNAYYGRTGFWPRGRRILWKFEVCLYDKKVGKSGAE